MVYSRKPKWSRRMIYQLLSNQWFLHCQQLKQLLHTWTSSIHGNQIDYIISTRRWKSLSYFSKILVWDDYGIDHELLMYTFQFKPSEEQSQQSFPMIRPLGINPLFTRRTWETILKSWASLTENQRNWEIKEVVKDEYQKRLPKAKKQKKAKWMSEQTKHAKYFTMFLISYTSKIIIKIIQTDYNIVCGKRDAKCLSWL